MDATIKPLPLLPSLLWFGIPSSVFVVVTWFGIPFFEAITGLPLILVWFALGGGAVFMPLFFGAIIAARMEGVRLSWPAMRKRLRLQRMSRTDWLFAIAGVIAIMAGMGLITLFFQWVGRPLDTAPPFLEAYRGLAPGQEWFLAIWAVFFFFNIVGEELMWRGYLMPRQEAVFGSRAWMVQGLLWTGFHICFGLDLMILLLPILFIEPWMVERRRNTWVGVVIHALVNGPVFVAMSMGWIS